LKTILLGATDSAEPKFAQFYLYDSQEAMQRPIERDPGLQPEILAELDYMLHLSDNPYVQAYRRHPPHVLLRITRDLRKSVAKISARAEVGPLSTVAANRKRFVLLHALDLLNGVQTHAAY